MAPSDSPFIRNFSMLEDPRIDRSRRHELIDIVVLAVCGVLCGYEDYEKIAFFADAKHDFFKTFLALPNGIPSSDTFRRVFAKLDPRCFQECFVSWIEEIATLTKGEVVAIDGKTLRGSIDRASSKAAIHMVSAWATENELVLGQVKIDDKSNEITAIPKLLEVLKLSGCVVTIDAMGCQRDIAEKIVEAKADYTLALKENQPTLHADVVAHFAKLDRRKLDMIGTRDKGHGREELRFYYVADVPDAIREAHDWPHLASIGLVSSVRVDGDKTSTEERYYINSYGADAEKFARAVRAHWGIENRLHWCLDVFFGDDECRVRKDHGPENISVLKRVALNLLKKDPAKKSLAIKRMACALDEKRLLKTLMSRHI